MNDTCENALLPLFWILQHGMSLWLNILKCEASGVSLSLCVSLCPDLSAMISHTACQAVYVCVHVCEIFMHCSGAMWFGDAPVVNTSLPPSPSSSCSRSLLCLTCAYCMQPLLSALLRSPSCGHTVFLRHLGRATLFKSPRYFSECWKIDYTDMIMLP